MGSGIDLVRCNHYTPLCGARTKVGAGLGSRVSGIAAALTFSFAADTFPCPKCPDSEVLEQQTGEVRGSELQLRHVAHAKIMGFSPLSFRA